MNYYNSVIVLVLLALGVLCILISENDQISQDKKNVFFLTNILIALAAIAECAGVNIGRNPDIPRWVLATVKAADYTLTPLTGGALIALMRKPGAKRSPVSWVFLGNTIFQFISIFTGWMVVIDERNHYVHGPLYPVYMILYSAVLVIVVVRLISYGKTFRKQNRVSLYAITALIFIGIGMQEILGSDHRVAYIALTFGATYFYIHYSEFSQIEMEDQINEQQVIITRDALTGVFSRFAYIDAINALADGVPDDFAVFLFDINGLKETNDSLGHEAGDELICGAAQCIEKTIGKEGRTFRIGGDEFVVFTYMNNEQARTALKDLEKACSKWKGRKAQELSISAGYALAGDHEGYSVEDIAKVADNAMYKEKAKYYQQQDKDRRK